MIGPRQWCRVVGALAVLCARPGQCLTAALCRWNQSYLSLNLFSVLQKPNGGGQVVEGGWQGFQAPAVCKELAHIQAAEPDSVLLASLSIVLEHT